jgi:hypothetical protein
VDVEGHVRDICDFATPRGVDHEMIPALMSILDVAGKLH